MQEPKVIQCKDQFLTLNHYKEPLIEIKDGFGYDGALLGTVDGTKVQCHICGELFISVGMHVWQQHDMTANQYREKFHLSPKTSLISENEREERKMRMLRMLEAAGLEKVKKWRQAATLRSIEVIKGKKGKVMSLELKNKKGICPDQLLAKVTEVVNHLGYVPSKWEFVHYWDSQRYVFLINKTFGSWSKALTKLGLYRIRRTTARHGFSTSEKATHQRTINLLNTS